MSLMGCCSSFMECSDSKASVLPSNEYIIPEDVLEESQGKCLVIADDVFCGAYVGILVNARFRHLGYKFADVQILRMLRPPRQDAIFNPDEKIRRDPYIEASIHSFDLENVYFVYKVA